MSILSVSTYLWKKYIIFVIELPLSMSKLEQQLNASNQICWDYHCITKHNGTKQLWCALTSTDDSQEYSIDDELSEHCLSFSLIIYQILCVSGGPNSWKRNRQQLFTRLQMADMLNDNIKLPYLHKYIDNKWNAFEACW